MAEPAPNKEPPSDSPNEAYPQSAKDQQSGSDPGAANATDEPATNEESLEEEQEDEVGHADEEGDEEGKPQPVPAPEITEAAGESGRRRLAKRSMEYALADMYPEVQLLVENKRREWNYRDPNFIRALFLEAKTNAVAEWKVCRATFSKRKKPLLEVQETIASKLRRQQLETRQEKLQQEQQREERLHNHQQPNFAEVKLATNLTTQLRYNYTRNNPPIPRHFLAHYERFRKPPFHSYGVGSKGCKPDRRPSQ